MPRLDIHPAPSRSRRRPARTRLAAPWAAFALFGAAVLLRGALGAQEGARPQDGPPVEEHSPDDGHDHGEESHLEEIDPQSFTDDEQARLRRLFAEVVCACKSENWTRSLAGCPEPCARGQKQLIGTRIKQGWSDQDILTEQLQTHGPHVLARPPFDGMTGFWLYVLPFLILVHLAVAVIIILNRAVRPVAGDAGRGAPRAAIPAGERDRIGDDIERELDDMD